MSDLYRMICDKCGAAVATNELSHRARKCSCIDCGGNLRYFNDEEVSAATARVAELEAFVRSREIVSVDDLPSMTVKDRFKVWDGEDEGCFMVAIGSVALDAFDAMKREGR